MNRAPVADTWVNYQPRRAPDAARIGNSMPPSDAFKHPYPSKRRNLDNARSRSS